MRRRLLAVLAVALISVSFLAAKGESEARASESEVDYTTAEEQAGGTLNDRIMSSMASIFDDITRNFCFALSPFPSVMVKVYGSDLKGTGDSPKLKDVTLLSESAYSGEYLKQPNSATGPAGDLSLGRSAENQKHSWRIVSILFLSFFMAEVIFSAVKGYITEEGDWVRKLASKAFVCLCLFLLASFVPYMVEGFRLGFSRIAVTISGYSSASDAQIDVGNVFELPGNVLRTSSNVINMMDPSSLGRSNSDLVYSKDTFGNALLKLLFLVIKLFAMVMVSFAALHVMLNVIEVYLLLGIVMVLLPFTVFSPVKFLGEKAILSLFSNVLELFVIIVIMLSSLTVTEAVVNTIMQSVSTSYSTIAVTVDTRGGGSGGILEGVDGSTIRLRYDSPEYRSNAPSVHSSDDLSWLGDIPLGDHIVMVLGDDGFTGGAYGFDAQKDFRGASLYNSDPYIKAVSDYIAKYFMDNKESLSGSVQTLEYYHKALLRQRKVSGSYSDYYKSDDVTFWTLPAKDKAAVIEAMAADEECCIGGDAAKPLVAFNTTVNEQYAETVTSTGDNNIYVIYLFMCLLCIFLQTYFLNQSSMITNALLSGNVAGESLSAAGMKKGMALAMAATGAAYNGTAGQVFKAGHNLTQYGAGTVYSKRKAAMEEGEHKSGIVNALTYTYSGGKGVTGK